MWILSLSYRSLLIESFLVKIAGGGIKVTCGGNLKLSSEFIMAAVSHLILVSLGKMPRTAIWVLGYFKVINLTVSSIVSTIAAVVLLLLLVVMLLEPQQMMIFLVLAVIDPLMILHSMC